MIVMVYMNVHPYQLEYHSIIIYTLRERINKIKWNLIELVERIKKWIKLQKQKAKKNDSEIKI